MRTFVFAAVLAAVLTAAQVTGSGLFLEANAVKGIAVTAVLATLIDNVGGNS